MRTTIDIDDRLLIGARAEAARSGMTVSGLVERALVESFGRRRRSHSRPAVELPTFPGTLRPGIDLDNSSALIDLMDRTRA